MYCEICHLMIVSISVLTLRWQNSASWSKHAGGGGDEGDGGGPGGSGGDGEGRARRGRRQWRQRAAILAGQLAVDHEVSGLAIHDLINERAHPTLAERCVLVNARRRRWRLQDDYMGHKRELLSLQEGHAKDLARLARARQ